MLDSLVYVIIFGVGLCQLLVCLTGFLLLLRLFADGQEFVEVLDGLLQVAKLLVNISYFLIALGLLNLVL